ncbi:hypothetical protein V1525DRAFT_390666 [Lipomyces kononenkoae]|uniref:Uncharacterized protein n=1 Tax=Lipomyces kononenkoae TaxID=34357 RepID=A0ACC3SUD0_LIPKO
MLSNYNAETNLKPKEFKGIRFDGKPENLETFLNKLSTDFRLYDSQFPTDRNRLAALLALKQRPNEDLLDHITEFKVLRSQVLWPEETKASIFLETLTAELKSSIRRSDVDLESYDKVKQKAQRPEREFLDTKKQRARPVAAVGASLRSVKSETAYKGEYLKKGLCSLAVQIVSAIDQSSTGSALSRIVV